MSFRRFASFLLVAALVAPVAAQKPGAYRVPRTPWGDPDLQGIWPSTAMVGVPMQRDKRFGERNLLTEQEFKEREAAAAKQIAADNAEFDLDNVPADVVAMGTVGGPVSPPPHWLERGIPSMQASLVVDPPDGRIPPLAADAQQRAAARQKARQGRGPADSYEDRSLYDRCVTRGLIGSMLPVIYNNGNEIVQTPGQVVIRLEMIHETRVIPLDGRPRTGIRQYLGEPRGRWDGDTLVVETTNFTDRTGIGANGGGQQHSEALRVIERFTRVDAETIQYEATIDDPLTYSRPWRMAFPLKRDPDYGMFEYACHEGNHAIANILSGARADEAKGSQK
jgi:hypothetical protein